jgi:hypothetical protein
MLAHYAGGPSFFFGTRWREPVQRAYHITDDVGGHLGVARRGVELGMFEQNHPFIGFGL